MSQFRMVENTFANLCRGGAVALAVILLPPFLVRILSKDAYATWLLILQLSTYVSLLDLGIQTAIGRFVAHYNELGDWKQRDSVISSAIAILSGSGLVAIAGISLLAWQLVHLFKDMPTALQQDARLALLFVGGSLAVSLPFSVFGAVFIGLHRNDVPAWIIGIGKVFGGIFVVLVAQLTNSIVMMAVMTGFMNLATGFWQFLAYKKLASGYQISPAIVSRKSLGEILDSCIALTISSLGVLLVSGLDTIIIGFFDYKSISYYVLAATLTNFVFGISSSMLNTIIPIASSIGAKNEPDKLGSLLVSTTKYAVVLLIASNLPLFLLSRIVITLWIGADYATQTSHLFELLIAANFIRQIGAPYFMIAVGCGEHRKIILSPVVEAVTNLFASVLLTSRIGASGVAIGTLIGGFASIGFHFFYNLPRTRKIFVPNKLDLATAIFKPMILVVIPTIFISIVIKYYPLTMATSITISIFVIVVGWMMLWQYGLNFDDRHALISAVKTAITKK